MKKRPVYLSNLRSLDNRPVEAIQKLRLHEVAVLSRQYRLDHRMSTYRRLNIATQVATYGRQIRGVP